MSAPQTGILQTYNSLTDKHLVGYFSNARIRQHLQRAGLISRTGRIIPEKEYRINVLRRDHKKCVQECMARTIFHEALNMEHHHQLKIERELENSMRKERAQKVKVEQSRRLAEGAGPMHFPHPPLGPQNHYRLRPLTAGEPAGCSQLTSGNRQQPFHLPPLCSCAPVGSVPKASRAEEKHHALEYDQQFASGGERSGLRLKNSVEYVTSISPYKLPVINKYVIPVPPPFPPKGDKSINAVRSGMLRSRRFHPITAQDYRKQFLTKNSGEFPKHSLQSNVLVTMVFLGKPLHLAHGDTDYRAEIKVYQQHCGGENICVYKGKLLEGETFQFVSKRHHNFPFGLTFFLNGIQVDRLSCCCEYKHLRLGGRHGYFSFLNVEGGSPCHRCIIATGVAKMLFPLRRKMENCEKKHGDSWRDGVHNEPSKSSVEQETSKSSVLVILPCHEKSVETSEDKMETGHDYRKEEKNMCDCESEDSQEYTGKNDTRSARFLSPISTQCSNENDSQAEIMKDDVEDEEEYNIKRASDNAAHALYGNQNRENKQLRIEENWETSALGKEERDETENAKPEDLTAREDTGIFHENIMAIQHQSPEVNEECKQTGSVESETGEDVEENANTRNDGEENLLVPLENNTADMEDSNEESPQRDNQSEYGEDIEADGEDKGERQTGDEMNGMSQSSSDDISHNLDYEEENRNSSQKAQQASDSEEDESDEYSGGASEDDKQVGPGGAFLAEGTKAPDVQKAAEQVLQEGQMVEEREALEKEDFVAEGGDACTEEAREKMAWAGDFLPEEDTVAVQQMESQFVVEESTLEESTMAEGHKGMGTGNRIDPDAKVACGEQEALMEGVESEATLEVRGEKLAGALLGREADRVASEGEEVAVEVFQGEEATEEASEAKEAVGATGPLVEEVVGETVSEAEEAIEEEGSVSKGEEAVEDVPLAGEGIATVAGSEGDEGVEEAVSETEEAMAKPGTLLEPLGDKNIHTEEATLKGKVFVNPNEGFVNPNEGFVNPNEGFVNRNDDFVNRNDDFVNRNEGFVNPNEDFVNPNEGFVNPNEDFANLNEAFVNPNEAFVNPEEDIINPKEEIINPNAEFVKPNEFSWLKAAGEEQMEMGKAAVGAATSYTDKTSEEERNSLMIAEAAVDESMEPDKNPVWQVASGFDALVDAGEDRISERTSQWEENTAAGEEEGAAETHSSEIPSLGSKAKTEHAMKEKPGGGVMGISAEKGREESGGGKGVMSATVGPSKLEAGMEGSLECAKEREEWVSGEGAVDGAALPAPVLCVGRMGEAGLVAFAVVSGQAGLGTLTEAAVGQEVAGGGRLGEGTVGQEKVVGAVWSELSVTGMAAAEGVSAEGRGTAWETEMDREGGVADGAMACGRGANWEVALGCEERMPAPAEAKGQDEAGWEWDTAHVSAQHGEPCGAMSQAQPAVLGIGAEDGEGWPQERTEQSGMKAEGEQPGLCENMGEREGVDVFENIWNTGVREQRKDSPVGRSPVAPGATYAFERSCDPCEDISNPDAVPVPSV